MPRSPRDKELAQAIVDLISVHCLAFSIETKTLISPNTSDDAAWATIVRSYIPTMPLGDITQPRFIVMPIAISNDVLTRAQDSEVYQILLSAAQKMEVDDSTHDHRTIADALDSLVQECLQTLSQNHLIGLSESRGSAYLTNWRRDSAYEQEMAQGSHAIMMNSLLNYGAVYDRF